MGIRFILGRANADKGTFVNEQMDKVLAESNSAEVFYLVPDHVKFDSEVDVLEWCKMKSNQSTSMVGAMRLQVFSFSRLAWYLLQGKQDLNKIQLSQTGVSMLIKKILIENKDELGIFRGEANLHGFVERLSELFLEFQNGDIESEDLVTLFEGEEDGKSDEYGLKLKDIDLLYNKYLAEIEGKYFKHEELIENLIDEINERDLSNTHIYINYFETFSALEQKLLVAFAKNAGDVSIVLTMDDYPKEGTPLASNLFYQSHKTHIRLKEVFAEQGINDTRDEWINKSLETNSSEIDLLEKYWLESSQPNLQIFDIPQTIEKNNIQIWETTTKQAEMLHISNKIHHLVTSGKYRYKDILVVSREIENYADILKPYFKRNNIPVFVHHTESMSSHPLVELISSLINIAQRYYQYEDLMRFLKNGLFIPQDFNEGDWQNHVDIAENVMLAYGYEGKYVAQDREWIYSRFEREEDKDSPSNEIQTMANIVRLVLRDTLLDFVESLTNTENFIEAIKLIYSFLVDNGIKEKMVDWRNQALDKEDLELARKHEQVWSTWVSLVDEFIEILGNQKWDINVFSKILQTGFENASYSMVPPAIDQVLVTNMDWSRVSRRKVVFYLGMNNAALPKFSTNDSILTDEDREVLQDSLDSDKYLAPTASQKILEEPFTAYRAFNFAEEKVIFSFSKKQADGEDLQISPYIERIKKTFNLVVQHRFENIQFSAEEQSNVNNDEYSEYIGSVDSTKPIIISLLRNSKNQGIGIPDFWMSVIGLLQEKANIMNSPSFNSLNYKNRAKKIPDELALELYGEDLHLSVSQLESFYTDPYSHFLTYGLKLQERKLLELTPAETGSFYHDALDHIVQKLLELEKEGKNPTDSELEEIYQSVLEDMVDNPRYKIFETTNQMAYVKILLMNTVKNRAKVFNKENRASKSKPQFTEFNFGRASKYPGLEFPLQSGGKIHLRGQVDRVDLMRVEDKQYLTVIDYKSSDKNFTFGDILAGLMMQLITYLDVVQHNSLALFGNKAQLGGMFYSHIKNYTLNDKDLKSHDRDAILDKLIKEYQYQGHFIDDRDYIESLDSVLEEAQTSSLIYPVTIKKDGDLASNTLNKVFTREEFELLLEFNRNLVRKAGNKILDGENQISPIVEHGSNIRLPFSLERYRSINQFDPLLPENNYRFKKNISSRDKSTFIDELKSRLNKTEEEETDE